jgi:ABC-type transport system involved in cytochrome c biogenesis ATPase subunit
VGLGSLAGLPAGYLSAGQRRRLALARLIAAPRSIWLLDEPTAALDAAGQQRLGELMRTHLAGGGLIVAATHGPLGIAAKELRLDGQTSAQAQSADPSPQALRALSPESLRGATPAFSPQAGGESEAVPE